jgi:hypothetical protein
MDCVAVGSRKGREIRTGKADAHFHRWRGFRVCCPGTTGNAGTVRAFSFNCVRPCGAQSDRKQIVITRFEPLRGRGGELTRFGVQPEEELNGRLSPDGCFALLPSPGDPIRVISLRRKPESVVPTNGLNAKQYIRWNTKGSGFYVTNRVKGGMDLFFVDIGPLTKIMAQRWRLCSHALESTDGRHLAIQGSSLDQNLWLVEFP